MNVIEKRLYSCLLRKFNYQIKNKTIQYQIACCINYADRRHNSNTPKKEKTIQIKAEIPTDVKNDWVGPPDAISNIRPLKLHIPADESDVERNFRLRREELVQWNHEFWSHNNENFMKEKEEFIKDRTSGLVNGSDDKDASQKSLSTEEISMFYREFLNRNYKQHLDYNMNWYKKNVRLLWPAFKVALYSIKKKVFHRKT